MKIPVINKSHNNLPKYAHLPVIMKNDNGNRRKLSKRLDPEASVTYFIEQGYPTDALLIYLFDPTFSSPWTLGVMGVITGIGTLLLIVFLMRGYLPAFSGTLHVECDPNQFLILYRAFLRKPYPLPVVYTLGHFYLGEFDRAAMYAEEAMHKKGMYRFSMYCFMTSNGTPN